jgi:hypothetical protein
VFLDFIYYFVIISPMTEIDPTSIRVLNTDGDPILQVDFPQEGDINSAQALAEAHNGTVVELDSPVAKFIELSSGTE